MDPTIPFLHASALPSEEQERASHLNHLLPSLSSYIRDYKAALSLFDFAFAERSRIYAEVTRIRKAYSPRNPDRNPEWDPTWFRSTTNEMYAQMDHFAGWEEVAARDITMSVYHFRHLLVAITSSAFKSPALLRLTDESVLRTIMPIFEKNFIKSERARNAVAHSAELVLTANEVKKNALSGEVADEPFTITGGGSLFVRCFLSGRKFSMTIFGEMVTVNITHESLNVLTSLRDSILSAFAPAFNELRKRHAQSLKDAVSTAEHGRPTIDETDHRS